MGEVVHIAEWQARHVAAFIASVREDWDAAGILAAMGNARERGDALDVAVAALFAAMDKRNRTPAVIAMTGAHWRHVAGRKSMSRDTPTRDETCATCYEPRSVCKAKWGGDHEFESVAEAKARAIEAAERRKEHRPAPAYINGRPVEDVDLP